MMKAGSGGAGGPELFPGSVDHRWPQAELLLGSFANPLKAAGAGPPFSALSIDHLAPQNVTAFPTPAFRSPITNEPPTVSAPIRNTHEVIAVLPPSSRIVVVTANGPVEVYVCVPFTTKPPPLAVTVPDVAGVESPQSIVAVKSAEVANVLASVKLATTPENDWPETWLVQVAVRGASATFAVDAAVAVLLGVSMSV